MERKSKQFTFRVFIKASCLFIPILLLLFANNLNAQQVIPNPVCDGYTFELHPDGCPGWDQDSISFYHWYDIYYIFDESLIGNVYNPSATGIWTMLVGSPGYNLLKNSIETPKEQQYYLQIFYIENGINKTSNGSVIAFLTEITITETVTNVTCYGNSDGAIDITVDVAGSSPTFIYSWSNGATTQDISGLTAGDYTVTVTEGGGCTLTKVINVATPTQNTVVLTRKTDVTCSGGNDGIITVSGAGGTIPYSYSWNTGAVTPTISSLSAGNYCVTVTDAQSCTATACYDVTEPFFKANAIVMSPVSCTGCTDGSVSVNVMLGVAPYAYYWLPGGETTQTINGLSAGTYSVTVTDGNSCTATSSTTVTERITFYSIVPDPVCDGYPFDLHPDGCPGWDSGSIYFYHWYDLTYVFDQTSFGNFYHPSFTGIWTMLVGSPGYNLLVNSPLTPKQCDYYLDITFIENGKMENGFGVLKAVLSSLMTNTNLQNIAINSMQNTCFDATQTITVAGSGNTFEVADGGSANLVAGQSILFYPGTTVFPGGYLSGKITQTGQYCCISGPNPVAGSFTSGEDVILGEEAINIPSGSSSFLIYPNPTTETFALELIDIATDQTIQVDIYSMRGEKILEEQFIGERKYEFSLSNKPVGVYFIRIIAGDKVETGKIIKR